MRKIIYYLVCSLIFTSLKAQVLHHQTFSSLGKNVLTSSGFVLSQSIGQSSPSGTFSNADFVVQQGFQQYALNKYTVKTSGITTRVYPNPFIADLSLEFSQSFNEQAQVSLYDLSGRLVKNIYGKILGNMFKVDFSDLADDHYILVMNIGAFKFSTKVIKINKL